MTVGPDFDIGNIAEIVSLYSTSFHFCLLTREQTEGCPGAEITAILTIQNNLSLMLVQFILRRSYCLNPSRFLTMLLLRLIVV